MARIRTIKPDFWTDEKVVELSAFARLLFIGLWNFADDDGRMAYSPKKIKMQIFPADTLDISELFGEIQCEGLIELYTVDSIKYLQINCFAKHQKIDKRTPSKLPDSRGVTPTSSELPVTVPTEGKGREGNGMEKSKEATEGGNLDLENKTHPVALQTYLDHCKTENTKPIPENDTIFQYTETVGIPNEWLDLHWKVFKEKHLLTGSKRQKNWRQTFRNSVQANWYKIWYIQPDGSCVLSTVGKQADRAYAERVAA